MVFSFLGGFQRKIFEIMRSLLMFQPDFNFSEGGNLNIFRHKNQVTSYVPFPGENSPYDYAVLYKVIP